MKETYQIVGKEDRGRLEQFLFENGGFLLPMVELISSPSF